MSDDNNSEKYNVHAQWSAVCDYCDNPVEYYCKTCGIKLCSPCKDDHLSKKLYRHHEVVRYTSGLGQRTKIQSECTNHPGERHQLYCKPCQIPICSSCIVETHASHELITINDAYEDIKSKATSQFETLAQTIRPRLQNILEGLSKSQVDILSAIADIEQRMKDSAQHIHKEVDDILAGNIKEIQKIKDDTIMPLLREEFEKTRQKISDIDREILAYDKHLRSDDPDDLLKFIMDRDEDTISMDSNQIDAVQLLPIFTPGRISRESLQQQFGKLTILGHSKPLPTLCTGGGTEDTSDRLKQDAVCQWTMEYDASGIRQRSSNEAWIHGHGSMNFDLWENNGKVIHTVHAGCTLYRVSGKYVTNDGGLLYSDYDNRCIRSLSPRGQVRFLFSTKGSRPLGLSRLMSGELVVGMEGGVIRIYNADGRVVREVKSDHVNNPYYLTINKLTTDICVSDNCSTVVVFKENGDYRFTYSGHGSSFTFVPYDLCSDCEGRLLITDRNNHRIHIVGQDGQFIQYLVTEHDGIQNPVSIDVDDHGYIWIGELSSKKVKIIKYLQ